MDGELLWRIKTFFNYWRERRDFICDLDFGKHNHEANVLLWAAFDALSNLWAGDIGKECCSSKGKRLVFDAFLECYGGELFQIVSLPDVWNRVDRGDILVDRKKNLKLDKDVCTFLSKIGDRQTPTFKNKHEFRHSSDDWNIETVITATLGGCPGTNRTEIEEWLILSRYGAIAYKEMRSAYIHGGQPGKGAHGFELSESATRPTYGSGMYTTPPSIGFKIEFMYPC